jgi:hypothetical protein
MPKRWNIYSKNNRRKLPKSRERNKYPDTEMSKVTTG